MGHPQCCELKDKRESWATRPGETFRLSPVSSEKGSVRSVQKETHVRLSRSYDGHVWESQALLHAALNFERTSSSLLFAFTSYLLEDYV